MAAVLPTSGQVSEVCRPGARRAGATEERPIMKIVIIGGTGLIGKRLVKMLRDSGHEAVPASPSTGINSVTGAGLSEAMTGAGAVVDVTNAPSWADAAVMSFFETSTRNLLRAAAA